MSLTAMLSDLHSRASIPYGIPTLYLFSAMQTTPSGDASQLLLSASHLGGSTSKLRSYFVIALKPS